MQKLKLLLLAVCICQWCHAQETSPKDSSKLRYELDMGFGMYYQFSSFGQSALKEANFPTTLERRPNERQVRNNWGLNDDLVTDNPFFHGSYFAKMGGRFFFGDGFQISGSLIAEQRGFSDGVFSRQTLNFYPYLNASYSKRYGKFSYLIQAGDFWNYKSYEGLTFYNLETQSWVVKLQYDKFYVKHMGVGDLLIGIGLGIDDLYDYSTGFESLHLNDAKSVAMDIRFGYSNNRNSRNGGFYNLSTKVTVAEKSEFYAQTSFRRQGNAAFLIGVKDSREIGSKFRIDLLAELRSYSADFNLGYANIVYYRDPEEPSSYTNNRNRVFIPLDFFERPFSQWAVFTEYQGEDVLGLVARVDASYTLFRQSSIDVGLDINYISSDQENFTYFFYDIGYVVRPYKDLEISLSMTNRVSNLDKNYPSLYLTSSPYFLVRMYKPLRFVRENDARHQLLIQ